MVHCSSHGDSLTGDSKVEARFHTEVVGSDAYGYALVQHRNESLVKSKTDRLEGNKRRIPMKYVGTVAEKFLKIEKS